MAEPHNRARGEVLLAIDGRPHRLCVTLGAIAELEAAFDLSCIGELGERLAQLTASDLIIVVAALTAGGGEARSTAELAVARVDTREAAVAVAAAFKAAFDD